MKIFLPGGAGLVGLNLIALLQQEHPDWQLIVVDKKQSAIAIGKSLFPGTVFICEDLCDVATTKWPHLADDCDACVMLQAEIGNTDSSAFIRNNIQSTRVVLDFLRKIGLNRVVHISSSVVNSVATDQYTETKRKQEELVLESFPSAVVLRPTLMFGWFDRKHLGWLARFLKTSPIFPIPGSGRFIRQPLYVQDFCHIILSCLENPQLTGSYDITGTERISYIGLMRLLRQTVNSQSLIIHLPIWLFGLLLQAWALITQQPAFTKDQLKALTAGDEFELIDWPRIFDVQPTRLGDAIMATHHQARFSNVFIPY